MEITKVMQPKGSNQCGQAIIAMLGNISIKEAIEIMGTAGLTKTKHLLQGLKIMGLQTGSDRLIRIPKDWTKPKLCIVHIGFGNHWKKHWTLWNGYENCFYDPAFRPKMKETFYDSDCFSQGAKMLSYLEIKGKSRCVVED